MKISAISSSIFFLSLIACEQPQTFTNKDLMTVDAEFSAYSEANGPYEAWDRFLVDNAIGLPEGADFTWDKATARNAFAEFPETASLTWTPLGGDIAESGEVGYTYGRYIVRSIAPDGAITESHGKYITIWKRQADSSWKVVLDGGSSSPAPEN